MGLSGYAENEIYAFWFQKWPKDGPSYDNATKMFNIKSLCYQRINCETFFKLRSEKCKIMWYINHDILVTIVTKRTGDPHFFFEFMSGAVKEFVPNLRKINGVEIARLHYLKQLAMATNLLPALEIPPNFHIPCDFHRKQNWYNPLSSISISTLR